MMEFSDEPDEDGLPTTEEFLSNLRRGLPTTYLAGDFQTSHRDYGE